MAGEPGVLGEILLCPCVNAIQVHNAGRCHGADTGDTRDDGPGTRRAGDAEVLAHLSSWDFEDLHEPQHVQALGEGVARRKGELADVLAEDRNSKLELLHSVPEKDELGLSFAAQHSFSNADA